MNQSQTIIAALSEGKQMELEEWLKIMDEWMGTANDSLARRLDVAPFNKKYKLFDGAILYRGMTLEIMDLQEVIHTRRSINHVKFSSWTHSLDRAIDAASVAPGAKNGAKVPVVFKSKLSPAQVLVNIKRLCELKPNGWKPPSFCDEEEVIVRPGIKLGKSNLVKISGKPWKTVKKWRHGMVNIDLTKPPKERF